MLNRTSTVFFVLVQQHGLSEQEADRRMAAGNKVLDDIYSLLLERRREQGESCEVCGHGWPHITVEVQVDANGELDYLVHEFCEHRKDWGFAAVEMAKAVSRPT